jgi:hypothetical protein
LCGWPAEEYLILSVPLSKPARVNVICDDCAGEITDWWLKQRVRAEARGLQKT